MTLTTQSEGRAFVDGDADEQRRQQVARIVNSRSFRNSPLLQKFLQFVTSHEAASGRGELSEYAIATRVLGRPHDFDPASDTIVRTQAYRLRTKLKEYYETEGKADTVILEIPKGHYIPSFSTRAALNSTGNPSDTNTEIRERYRVLPTHGQQRRRRLLIAGVSLLSLVSFLLGTFLGSHWLSANEPRDYSIPVPEPIANFWRSFVSRNDVILAYTDSVFLETESGDLLSFRNGAVADRGALVGRATARTDSLNPSLAERAGPLYYEDGFTGTGEVPAVGHLTSLLAALGATVQVKRGRLVTADDLRNHDIIFLGSPFANQVLADMHLAQRFTFKEPTGPPYLWQGLIADNRPTGPGNSVYQIERDPQTRVIRADYALFDVFPGPALGRRIVVLAGLSTSGTQGATEFATSSEGLQQVLSLIGISNGNRRVFPPYFECLLRVEAARGLDALGTRFVSGSPIRIQDKP